MKNEVIIGDCAEVLKQFPDNYFDLIIVDPPYGIGENGKKHKTRGLLAKPTDYGNFLWDVKLSKTHINEIIRVSKNQIILGGNYYADWLPPSSCWIIWDKKNAGTCFADCEIAWTSFKSAIRLFSWKWNGMLQEDMKHKEKRVYPTQKPIALYKWLLEKYAKPDFKVCDPCCGSGTIFAASNQLPEFNLTCVGIDKNSAALPIILERGQLNTCTLNNFEEVV